MFSYDKGRFDEFEEYFVDNKCVFKGKLKDFYKGLSDKSIFYCINGGGMMRDGKIIRNGLYFEGSYYFPDVFELRELDKNELFKRYDLVKYRLCKNEIDKRKEEKRRKKAEIYKKNKKYLKYKYYAKTKFGDLIHTAYSVGELAKKMGVSTDVIRYRKKHKPKNSWYVEVEISEKDKKG